VSSDIQMHKRLKNFTFSRASFPGDPLLFSQAETYTPIILLLDDIPEIRALEESWRSKNVRLICAETREKGMQIAEAPDLIICLCDGDLPEYTKIMEAVRRKPALLQTPILMILESGLGEIPTSVIDDPLQDFLYRPFHPAEPLIRCQKLLSLKGAAQQLAAREQERSAQLLLSENRFRLMVESIEDYAMFMVDLRGGITSWNRGAERLTGYTESEAMGQHFSILYPREDLNADHALYELAMARRNGRHEEEGWRVRKNGSRYYAQIQVWPMEDKSGEIIGFVKITRDITARRSSEQALKESEAKFRTITDAMPQIVWSTLPDGFHDFFNEQWYRYTGFQEGSTDGFNWDKGLHPEDRTRARYVWQRSLDTGQTYEIQYRLRHFSGSYRWTLGRALPVRNENGVIVRWMGTLTDIHEQKQAEEALKDAARRKDEFLAMLAHELRNPLAPLRNSALLLSRLIANEDARAQGAVNVIERQVRHMACLIDDLLDVARISRGKIDIRKEELDLLEVVSHTVDDFASDYEAKAVHLRTEFTSQPLWLEGDRTRVAQVIGNLLHNALKFTEPGGQVTVRLVPEENSDPHTPAMAILQVMDTGVGIAADIAANLFNPFIQASQGLARSKGGLGLGLALVKGFIELHGGTVSAQSEGKGKGAVFTLRLPLMQNRAEPASQSDIAKPQQQLRILLIDDNTDMLQTLSTLLNMEGHEVETAEDGESGLEAIRAQSPDLVLCDIGLPGALDGYAVARAVRADAQLAQVYMVALSGYGQERDRQRAKASGFDNHLLKPLNFGELAKLLADVKPQHLR
jgi:PAS domain S-box-containing protein